MESMNHVSMDVEDDQALINKVGHKCPRCESTNTKFDFYQNHQESQPHHYCKDCRRGWSVNDKLRDIPVGGGERKIQQPDVSMPDHTQKGLKCPCCESRNTKFAYYQNQNKSKPVHFCNDCLHYWMVAVGGTLWASPGEGKRQRSETSVGDQAPMSEMALKMKCPRCESTNTNFVYYKCKNESMLPVHFCKSCRRHWTVGGSLKINLSGGVGQRKKQQLKDSGLKASVEGLESQGFSKETTEVGQTECTQLLIPSVEEPQHLSLCLVESNNYIPKDTRGQKRDLEGSGEIASVEGCESNVASNEPLEVIHTEYSKSFSPSVVAHQPVSVCLQKFDSHTEKDSEGFHFVDEAAPTEEINLSDTSRSRESPEASNVVGHSSCGKKRNTFKAFGSNARGNEMAQLVSVDIATTISTQPNLEPLPLERSLPFIKSSFIWPQVESMEVYRFIPQQPHFEPLKEQNEHLREGAALGLMLSFPKLVEVTREAQLEDSKSMFDTKLKAVQIFEEYGFTVEPIRTQLVKLLLCKENCEQHDCMLKTATRGLTEVLESIALLEKDLQLLQEKKERQAFKVDELQRTSDEFKESILAARLKFHTLVAAPW